MATDATTVHAQPGPAKGPERPATAWFGAGGLRALFAAVAAPALAALAFPGVSSASGLLVPTTGAADIGLAGSAVAQPRSATGAQFANPAGLAAFTEPTVLGGPGVALANGKIDAEAPPGYHKSNQMVMLMPDVGAAYPIGDWTLGLSVHGCSGSVFDYGAEQSVGIYHRFYADNAMVGAPLGAAYRVSDRLWLGGELVLLYSRTQLKYAKPSVPELASGPVPFHFSVQGWGLQAVFGITWKPDDDWTLGLSARPPGRVWTDGSMKLPDGSRQDVDLEIEAPGSVSLGISRRLGRRWTLLYAFRWTDSSTFKNSRFRFDRTPSADGPYLPDAQDEWRHAVGAEFLVNERWVLRGGVAQANAIVGNKGVNPMSYDVEDVSVTLGQGYTKGRWSVDSAIMVFVGGDRHVPAADALVLPGHYSADPAAMVAVTLTRRF